MPPIFERGSREGKRVGDKKTAGKGKIKEWGKGRDVGGAPSSASFAVESFLSAPSFPVRFSSQKEVPPSGRNIPRGGVFVGVLRMHALRRGGTRLGVSKWGINFGEDFGVGGRKRWRWVREFCG